MKNLFFRFLFIVILMSGGQAQDRLDLGAKRIDDELLVKILSLSQLKELKPLRPADSEFRLRLYSLDDIVNNSDYSPENCAPKVETEVICGYRYFLAIHDGSLGVTGAVYDLGEVGEITKVEWLKSPDQNFARLRMKVSNYPIHAFKLNPKLVMKIKIVEIDVNLDALKIKVIR